MPISHGQCIQFLREWISRNENGESFIKRKELVMVTSNRKELPPCEVSWWVVAAVAALRVNTLEIFY